MRRRSGIPARGALLAAPSTIGVLLFVLVPVGVVAWLATQRWDLLGAPRFVGLANVAAVLADPVFWSAAGVTAALGLLVVPVQTALALVIALALVGPRAGATAFRTVLVLPWAAAPLALGIVWSWIFAPTGGLVSGLLGHTIGWIADPIGAPLIVAGALIWNHVGYVSLFFAAGLAAIPPAYADAAALDGAGPLQRLRFITLPLLRPTTLFVVVTSSAQLASVFDQVYGITGGGPGRSTEVLALQLYEQAFTTFDLGRAAVTTLVLLVALVLLTIVLRGRLDRRVARA